MVKKTFSSLFILFVFVGCSLQTRKEQTDLREYFSKKEYSQALEFLETTDIKKNEKLQLLFLMEKGILQYAKNDFKSSSDTFQKANDLVDRLYTKSVKEKIFSSLLNDNSETFYGAIFERSMLYYYQAFSFYRLVQKGFWYETSKEGVKTQIKLSEEQRKSYLNRSRATLLAWDSFFQEIQRSKKSNSLLAYDFSYKMAAAQLHRSFGKRRDDEIALILYQGAYDILERLGPTYASFNTEYIGFNKEIKETLKQKRKKKSKFIKKTAIFKDSLSDLKIKILRLTNKIRKYKKTRTEKKLQASKKEIKEAKAETNASFNIELGQISELRGRDFSFTLASALKNIKNPTTRSLVNNIGVPVLTYFAMGPLGLGYPSRHGNIRLYTSHDAGASLTKEVGVEFELPYVEITKLEADYYLELVDEKGAKTLHPLSLSAALSEASFISSQEKIANSFTKRSVRVGAKYAAAIAASFMTYNNMKESSGELFARPAALAQFVLLSKGIKASEKADTRHWTNLPGYVLSLETKLTDKLHHVFFVEKQSKTGEIKRRVSLGNIKVSGPRMELFTYRVQ